MKNILYLAFLLFALSSCQKEDPLTENKDATPNFGGTINNPGGGGGGTGGGGGGTGGGNETFDAVVDGQPFTLLSMVIQHSSGSDINIMAFDKSMTNAISLKIKDGITPGVYDFDGTNAADYSFISTGKTYFAKGPALEIISHDIAAKDISGNFFFTGFNVMDATDSVIVTNGSFEVNYD